MKVKYILIITIAIIGLTFISCKNAEDQKEIERLQSELMNCSNELVKLQDTPLQRELRAKKYLEANNLRRALDEYEGIVSNYAGTDEAEKAEKEVLRIKKEMEKIIAEKERKAALGFKAVSKNLKPGFGDLKINFEKVWLSKRWTFDNYGDRYHYRDAERGSKHVIARLSISSEIKNPRLPPILIYILKEGKLNRIGHMQYEFRRWKDYGSYLGNYADYGNDFAHTKTIRFNAGIQLAETELPKGKIYIVMKKEGCHTRHQVDFGSPEVSYRNSICDIKNILSVEDFDHNYVLIKTL